MPRTEPESATTFRPQVDARIDTIESGKDHQVKVINLYNNSDSIWLRNHLLWAVHNDVQVVIGKPI